MSRLKQALKLKFQTAGTGIIITVYTKGLAKHDYCFDNLLSTGIIVP